MDVNFIWKEYVNTKLKYLMLNRMSENKAEIELQDHTLCLLYNCILVNFLLWTMLFFYYFGELIDGHEVILLL